MAGTGRIAPTDALVVFTLDAPQPAVLEHGQGVEELG